jgi:putative transposase
MPYKQTATQCVVRLAALQGLSAATLAQCQTLRREAGRLWTDLVTLHSQTRLQGRWLNAADLEQATKGGQYALHSQSVQALCQKLAANVATAVELRKQELAETGRLQTEYPHHPKGYQTVVWKDQALTVLPDGRLRLPTGGQRPPLLLPFPAECQGANLRRAELTWRADHYELCLTLDTGAPVPPPLPAGEAAGVDLGEVHIAAVTTTRRHALVLSGRQLRSCKQWRNKVHRLLHQAAHKVVEFCAQEGVSRIAVGDVRDIQTGVSLGKRTNQQISQWPHGQFARYLREKAARLGISVEWIDEASSTRTCSVSGHVQPSSPRGRRFGCLGCGARVHRDVNGSANICSKAVYGCYSQVHDETVTYLRAIGVAPLTWAVSR